MELIIRLVIAFFASPDAGHAEGLRATASTYLDLETASQHVRSATVAAVAYDVDRDLLLSIAHHESRYQIGETTPEAGGAVSCGVMTPEPTFDRHACKAARSSMLAGYLAGARHLRGWIDACHGQMWCALMGYGGGWRAIRACSAGPVHADRSGVTIDLCTTPAVFLYRAKWIRRAIARALSIVPAS